MRNDRDRTPPATPEHNATNPTPQGNTLPAQGPRQERAPRMPHEQDESADHQGGEEPSARRMGGMAHDDVARGLVDTDKGPVLDQTYEKLREGAPDPKK